MDTIQLNEKELKYVERLSSFIINMDEDYEERMEKLETAKLLAESLLSRKGIPQIRLDYFSEPEYNLSNPRKSHKDNFESNGKYGVEILKHPHFLTYLRYFIYGANISSPLKTKLLELRDFCRDDKLFVDRASDLIKRHFVSLDINDRSYFIEEIFKFSLDIGISLSYAKHLRNKVKTWK